jgi:hypothetical protein
MFDIADRNHGHTRSFTSGSGRSRTWRPPNSDRTTSAASARRSDRQFGVRTLSLQFLFSNPFRGWRTWPWPWRTNLIAVVIAAVVVYVIVYGFVIRVVVVHI